MFSTAFGGCVVARKIFEKNELADFVRASYSAL